MRIVRMVVLAGLVLKSVLLGTLLWEPMSQAVGEAQGVARPEQEGPRAEKTAAAEVPLSPELLVQARGFRTLLEGIATRKAELETREKALALREESLRGLEKTVGEQVARLEGALKAEGVRGGGPVTGVSGAGGTRGAAPAPGGLSKIYESMKAEESAPIVEKMDDATIKEILGPMKEKQIGAILAAMSRDRAVAVTKLLAANPGGQTPQTADRR